MPQITAIKTFRPRNSRGEIVTPGTTMNVTDEDAQWYTNEERKMAIYGTAKQLQEHEAKMMRGFEDKGMRGTPEVSADHRSGVEPQKQGRETAELRSGINPATVRKEGAPEPAIEHRKRSLRGE
jgi:hypothetical protein